MKTLYSLLGLVLCAGNVQAATVFHSDTYEPSDPVSFSTPFPWSDAEVVLGPGASPFSGYSLELESGDQARYGVGIQTAPMDYAISLDVSPGNGRFTVFLDTGTVRRFEFLRSGLIRVWYPNESFTEVIGTFNPFDVINVSMSANYITNWWSISLNGVNVFGRALNPTDGWLRGVRLHATEGGTNYVDNFVLAGTPVPVPATVWLFGSALGILGWMRRKAT